jgi:type IV pilus assembly protein PilA
MLKLDSAQERSARDADDGGLEKNVMIHPTLEIVLLSTTAAATQELAMSSRSHSRGFTLIELMIVIAVIAILLSLAVPTYSNYSIRAKIAEGLSVANAAKTATAAACQEDRTLTGLTNNAAGYDFSTAGPSDGYVEDIQVSGACVTPVITIITKNTGAPDPQPIVLLVGDISLGSGRVSWVCFSNNAPNHLLPDTCRS